MLLTISFGTAMRKKILRILMSSVFIISVSANRIFESDVNGCDINQKHWDIIKWYFERCTFIEITEIALNRSHKSRFSNQLIRGLMSGITIVIIIRTILLNFRFPIRDSTLGANIYR